MAAVKGSYLNKKSCLGIIALATGVGKQDLQSGLQVIEKMGFTYKLSPTLKVNTGYFPGEDSWRANELMNFFQDPEVDAILCYGGGYGSARILPYLDFEIISKNPKLFIGYSDITALLNNIYQKSNLITVHGPMLKSFLRNFTKYTEENFRLGLQGDLLGDFKLPKGYKLKTLVTGEVTGEIVGGNLAILASLCGTEYQVDTEGKILFIEEVGEAAYAIDRMLNQLEQSGMSEKIIGLIWGKFAKCRPNKPETYEYTVKEVIEYYSKKWNVPTIYNLPVGHLAHNGILPIGCTAQLIASDEAKLVIREEFGI